MSTGPMAVALGKRVRNLRGERRMSQAEVARLLSERGHPVTQVTVGRLESARRSPGIDEIAGLASVFGLSLLEFLAPLDPTLGDAHDLTPAPVAASAPAETRPVMVELSEDSIRRLADAIAVNAAGAPRTAPRSDEDALRAPEDAPDPAGPAQAHGAAQ